MNAQCNIQNPTVLTFLYISAIFYGAHLLVALATFDHNQRERALRSSIRSSPGPRHSVYVYNLCSVVSLVVLGTINSISTHLACTSAMSGRDSKERRVFVILFAISAVGITLLRGVILFVRTYIVWNYDKRVVVIPLILFLTSTVLGVYYIKSLFADGSETSSLTPFFLFWCLAMGLNIALTMLIAGRVHLARQAVNTITLHRKLSISEVTDIKSRYTSIIRTLLKSATVYSIFMTIGLILTRRKGGIGFSFSSLVVQMECITSELAILRRASTSFGVQQASMSLDFPDSRLLHGKNFTSNARSILPEEMVVEEPMQRGRYHDVYSSGVAVPSRRDVDLVL